jgi:hypothetical protein
VFGSRPMGWSEPGWQRIPPFHREARSGTATGDATRAARSIMPLHQTARPAQCRFTAPFTPPESGQLLSKRYSTSTGTARRLTVSPYRAATAPWFVLVSPPSSAFLYGLVKKSARVAHGKSARYMPATAPHQNGGSFILVPHGCVNFSDTSDSTTRRRFRQQTFGSTNM